MKSNENTVVNSIFIGAALLVVGWVMNIVAIFNSPALGEWGGGWK